MDESSIRQYWERNAPTWIRLSRAGYDRCRDIQNSPAFFEMLPDVKGLTGLDIGCGEGHNTRQLAARGARSISRHRSSTPPPGTTNLAALITCSPALFNSPFANGPSISSQPS